MRDGRYAIFILYGSCNSDRPRPLTNIHLAQATVGLWLVDIFTMVRGDVDILRSKLAELIDDIIYLLDTVPLEWRQYLKSKCRLGTIFNRINDVHSFSFYVIRTKVGKYL